LLKNLLIRVQQRIHKESIIRRLWRRMMPSRIRYWLGSRLTVPPYLTKLNKIGRELDSRTASARPGQPLKILYGPSFSIYSPCFVHDRILSYALRLRGAEITPFYCNAIQSVECDFYGGVWQGKSFEESCRRCANLSRQLWENNPIPAIGLSRYLTDDDIKEASQKTESLDGEQWATYTEDNLPFGSWARDILVNNYVVGDFHLVPDYHSLGIAHLRNLLLLKPAYERLLNEFKPDRVVSHDSYYGMVAILQKKGIPFYSHWLGGRPNTWCYALNDSAMRLDFSRPWKKFSKLPLNEHQKNRVSNWLDGRPTGKEVVADLFLPKNASDSFDISRLTPDKPTALLAANVIWDMAALNRQVLFADMIDWIVETINWFAVHPEFQLIIKSHPVEVNPTIPETEERVEVALSKRNVKLPDNVFLLSPRIDVSVYQLFLVVQLGLVHTTTTGIEMVAAGLPVITTGRSPYRGFGFTLDPSTKEEYFNLINKTLTGGLTVDTQAQIDLVYRFILFYFYHYYIKIDIMDYTWGKLPELKINSVNDLLPGKNPPMDYILDSIMDGLPIVSEDRWPPES
jgi:hypothetical protein